MLIKLRQEVFCCVFGIGFLVLPNDCSDHIKLLNILAFQQIALFEDNVSIFLKSFLLKNACNKGFLSSIAVGVVFLLVKTLAELFPFGFGYGLFRF